MDIDLTKKDNAGIADILDFLKMQLEIIHPSKGASKILTEAAKRLREKR